MSDLTPTAHLQTVPLPRQTIAFNHSSPLWHPLWFAFVGALAMTLLLNTPFFDAIQARAAGQYSLQLSLVSLLFLLNFLLLTLFSFRPVQKPVFLLLFLLGSTALYFNTSYGVVIDKSMLQNALETDPAEAQGLLSGGMLWQLTKLMLFPLLAVTVIRTKIVRNKRFLLHWLAAILLIILTLLSIVTINYSQLAPFFRNFREVRYLALPVSTLSATVSLANNIRKTAFPVSFNQLGLDAKQLPAATSSTKPKLIVLVVGETARADHFGLNGYVRNTTPQLSALPVYSFKQASSCGTATAHSLPCMFSALSRTDYIESTAKNSSNVLDILQHAGVEVSWLDNNSGCKGVCDRVPSEFLFEQQNHSSCDKGQCLDSVLSERLPVYLSKANTATKDRLIVLHQLGSHGPEYYRRSAITDKAFVPECQNKQLQLCSQQDVINAYDNSIIATDQLLATVIKQLSAAKDYQTAMLYVSDHGESLGENGIYLHGLPYWMAPTAQTHIPLLWWMSENYITGQKVNTSCIQQQTEQKASHDNLFHTLLAIFNVQTTMRETQLELFSQCQNDLSAYK